MEERFEAFADDGSELGLVPRSEVHARGFWHRSAHVFVVASDGRLLLQRRALNKDLYAGCWDYAVGEHLRPGETFAEGAARGLMEELGTSARLEPVGPPVRRSFGGPGAAFHDREEQQAFVATHDGPFVPDPIEVAAITFATPAALNAWLAARPGDFTPWFAAELERLAAVLRMTGV